MKRTLLLVLVGFHAALLGAGVRFPGRFAPSEGLTSRLEKPCRDEICLDGIWQDVYLLRRPAVRIDDVYIHPLVSEGLLEIKVRVRNDGVRKASVLLAGRVHGWLNRSGKTVQEAPVPAWELGGQALEVPAVKLAVPAGDTLTQTLLIPADLKTWTPEHPELYALLLSLTQGKKTVDKKYERFGWREWTLRDGMLCLNGEPYPLRGEAMRAANAPEGSAWCRWEEQESDAHQVKLVVNADPEPYQSVVCYGAPDGRVRRILLAQGVVLSDKPQGRTLSIDFLSSEKGWNTLHKLLLHAGVPCADVTPSSFSRFDDGIYQPGILTRPVK